MSKQYTIGLDYGTNSVRALVVNVANGEEVAAAVWTYAHGTEGVILARDPNLARQHPADYLEGAETTIRKALALAAEKVPGFQADQVAGLGVDTTGSTPLPVDKEGRPLAFAKKFAENPAAMAWLWKDHTGVGEAAEITALAAKLRPQYLAKCGGTYSSEWFWSKVLRCLRVAPGVFKAAHSWVELADYVPAALTGTEHPDKFIAGVCAAGHKAMWNAKWGGYPDEKFLAKLDPQLAELRGRLTPRVYSIDRSVGGLTAEWAKRTGLTAGLPVAVGALTRISARSVRAWLRARLSRSSARAPVTSPFHPTPKNWPTCPVCAALWMGACCRGSMAWKPANRPWATSSTGGSITFNPAEKRR